MGRRPAGAGLSLLWRNPNQLKWHGSGSSMIPTHNACARNEKAARRRLAGNAKASALAHHLGDGLADVVDVLRVQRGDADAAGVHAVHAELVAKADHLVLRE